MQSATLDASAAGRARHSPVGDRAGLARALAVHPVAAIAALALAGIIQAAQAGGGQGKGERRHTWAKASGPPLQATGSPYSAVRLLAGDTRMGGRIQIQAA